MQLTNPFTDSDFAESQIKAGKAAKVHDINGVFVYQYPIYKDLCMFHATKWHDKIKELAKEEHAIYTLIESYQETKKPENAKEPFRDITPKHTLTIDLTQSEEEILNQMHPKGRYNIRLAAKKGIQVEESDDIMAFYKLLEKTGKRDDFNINPYRHYQAIVNVLQPKNKAKLYLAYLEDKPVAGLIATFIGDTATYFYGASDYKYRKYMAPYALQWTAMTEAKSRGFKNYDFLGIANPENPKDPLRGVSIFKQKFGGQRIVHPTSFAMVHKPVLYWLLKIKNKLGL